MIGRKFRFHDGKKGAALAVRVIVNSDQDLIRKILKDGTVVVHLKSDVEEPGQILVKYLSSTLNIDRNRFDIIEGKEGAEFLVSILDIDPPDIQRKILEKIS